MPLTLLLLSAAVFAAGPARPSPARADPEALLTRATAQFDQGEFDAAAATLDLALKAQPAPAIAARVHLYLGLVLATNGQDGRADAQLTEALRLDPLVEPDPARVKARLVGRFRAVRSRLTGVLSAAADRPGARVFVDGTDLGPAPVRKALGVGRHTVEARSDDGAVRCPPVEVTIFVDRVAPVLLSIQEPKGTLRVTSSPAGAEVVVDGRAIGTAPTTLDLPAGSHEVTVRIEAGEWRETVVIVEGRETARHAVLEATPVTPSGPSAFTSPAPTPAPVPVPVPAVAATAPAARSGSALRPAGFVLMGLGLVGGAGCGLFGVLGQAQDSTIRTGGLTTAQDIKSAEQLGLTFNTVAYVSGAVGAAALVTGLILVLAGGDDGPGPPVAVVPSPTGATLVVSGRFP